MMRKKKFSISRAVLIECLEKRAMLSAAIGPIHPERIIAGASSADTVDGITPSQIRRAYGFDQVSFAGGAVAADGAGQTIAIVDAFDDPSVVADLNTFDAQFGLSAPSAFKVVSQTGTNVLPIPDAGWASEIAMDVEWAHAVAPGAGILLVETNSDSAGDLMTGVNYARHVAGVSVLSLSWGGSEIVSNKDIENTSQLHFDPQFATPAGHAGVTFVAASGDTGARAGVDWPSSAPTVLSVGGTTLNFADASGTYSSETGWNGSSGGYSQLEFEPSFQISAQLSGKRSAPDVAYDGDPETGFAVYDSVESDGFVGWQVIAGTSAGTPQWAGLIAIANQGRSFNGLAPLDGRSQTLPLLYGLYSAPGTAGYANYLSDFNDITGNGGAHRKIFGQAVIGYDTVTGLGSPHVPDIVSILTGSTTSTIAAGAAPINGVFAANPPASVVAGSIGTLNLKLIDQMVVRFSGPLTITLFASPDGTMNGATALTGASISLVNIPRGASRVQQLRFTYPVNLVGTSQVVFATISAPGTNTTSAVVSAGAVSIDVPTVDFAVSFKNAAPAGIRANRAVNEVIVIQNLGNVPAKGTLNLLLHAGVVGNVVDPVVASLLNRHVSLLPGKMMTLAIHFKPTDLVGGAFSLTAEISSVTQPADANPTNDSATIGTVAL